MQQVLFIYLFIGVDMKKEYSLFELNEIIKELESEIKKAEDKLGVFKDYKIINSKIILDYTLSQAKALDEYRINKTETADKQRTETFEEYIAKNTGKFYKTLESYTDKKTGKRFKKFEKAYIKNKIEQTEKLRRRLQNIKEQKESIISGESNIKKNSVRIDKTKIQNNKLVNAYLKFALKELRIPKRKELEKITRISQSTLSRRLNEKEQTTDSKEFQYEMITEIKKIFDNNEKKFRDKQKYQLSEEKIEILTRIDLKFRELFTNKTIQKDNLRNMKQYEGNRKQYEDEPADDSGYEEESSRFQKE